MKNLLLLIQLLLTIICSVALFCLIATSHNQEHVIGAANTILQGIY